MAREVFGTETFDSLKEEKQKQEALEQLHDEAVAKYKEALSVPPPEDWTTEQITEAVEKKAAQQDKILSKIHQPSGLKSRRIQRRDWNRGHRKGLKPVKPRENSEAA